ncbi:hypothetical protein [Pyrococcus abyssi]|uniref:Uncharacterized protein n=1 Tax=Pyrococcus abyssi (strain GE5 / Orsay) TaxID=272844 RepID=G8ZJV8_PYRAB|nr:hypothetical protein [Pyrococcus abyssi]CCE71065.1 TPA: hypothetical protein PAB1054.1n [Pyrococcus abyssi GE5]
MDVEDYMLLFLTAWILVSALATSKVDVFLTLALIGILIVRTVGSEFLSKRQKDNLSPIIEILLAIFVIIVLKKVYEVLSK